MTTGTYTDPAFQIGITLAEERDGQVLATNDPWIKLGVGFRSYLAKLSGNQIKALLAIGLRINEKYEAWPSLRTIGKECGYSHQTASRAVKALKSLDLIEVVRNRKPDGSSEVNRYKIKAHFAYGVSKPGGGGPPADQGGGVTSGPGVVRLSVTEEEPFKEEPRPVVVGELTKIGISPSVAGQLATEFPEDRVREVLKMANAVDADNLPGLVVKALRDNWKQIPHRSNGRKPRSSWLASFSKGGTVEEEREKWREELGQGTNEWLPPGVAVEDATDEELRKAATGKELGLKYGEFFTGHT